ncbi:MAG: hypothetical protein LBI89_04050 [Prevotellaceae bacterium]|jgi:hypothetical protein|nr:hypothetical protein [Prevotellaceae bacterium]
MPAIAVMQQAVKFVRCFHICSLLRCKFTKKINKNNIPRILARQGGSIPAVLPRRRASFSLDDGRRSAATTGIVQPRRTGKLFYSKPRFIKLKKFNYICSRLT